MNSTEKSKTDVGISAGLLLLRIGVCCFMLVHGIAKIKGYSALKDKFPDPLGMGHQLSLIAAIGSEVGCSLLLLFGFLTRFAAIPLAFTMIIALFMVHAADPWKVKELAAMYLMVYIVLAIAGGGAWSVDRCLWRKKVKVKKPSK